MDNQWYIDTQGDPLGKLRGLVKQIWAEFQLNGMLVTTDGGAEARAIPRYITDPASIDKINPFKPLMEVNIARLVPELLASHPGGRVGALLRPCEMRALIEIGKHFPISLENLITVSVDCLGTLPADEYQWRLERIVKKSQTEITPTAETADELASEAIKFARQGGIIPYRYRSACQVCQSPAAEHADINFHVLGLPVRQKLLVSTADPKAAVAFHLEKLADGVADVALVGQHERLVLKMSERHQRTMERLNESLGAILPVDVEAVIHQLESCGECHKCLDVCPICSVDRPVRDAAGHYDRSSVIRWLVSCAGCGMCEQACPMHLPTAAIFAHIRQQLDKQWAYIPGRSIHDALPLI